MDRSESIDLSAAIAETADELRRSLGRSSQEADVERDAGRLVECLLELGDAWPGDELTRRSLVHAAVAHGRVRRAQEAAEDTLFLDYDRLRTTLWERIRQANLPPGTASDIIMGIDAAISLAVAASLRGFYQDVIARTGEWPLTIERLVWEWRYFADPRDS
jgi:hypothetical protein